MEQNQEHIQPDEDIQSREDFAEFNLISDDEVFVEETIQDEFSSHDEDDEDSLDEDDVEELDVSRDLINEDDEARYQEHIRRKKSDKIFNNSYNNGDGITEEVEAARKTSMKLWSGHRDTYMHDPQKYEDHLEFSIVQKDVFAFIDTCEEIQEILRNSEIVDSQRRKISKVDINRLYGIIYSNFLKISSAGGFVTAVHIVDAISAITSLDYKKIFDLMDYENKSSILLDLNTRSKILERFIKLGNKGGMIH